jgi:hypothetical protein
MTRPLSDMIPDLLGGRGLVGVPPEIALFHLRKAFINLCERSHVWIEDITFDIQQNVSDYPLDLPPETEAIALNADSNYTPYVSQASRSWSVLNTTPRLVGNTVWMQAPVEDVQNGATVKVTLKPTQEACDIPERLYQDWSDVIVDGAAARCFVIPKTEWYNISLATYYTKQYSVGVTRAKNSRVLKQSTGPLYMKGARF